MAQDESKLPEWKRKGFASRREYEEWRNDMLEDVRYGYC